MDKIIRRQSAILSGNLSVPAGQTKPLILKAQGQRYFIGSQLVGLVKNDAAAKLQMVQITPKNGEALNPEAVPLPLIAGTAERPLVLDTEIRLGPSEEIRVDVTNEDAVDAVVSFGFVGRYEAQG